MMSLTFGLFTQVSGSGPLGPLVSSVKVLFFFCVFFFGANPCQLNLIACCCILKLRLVFGKIQKRLLLHR